MEISVNRWFWWINKNVVENVLFSNLRIYQMNEDVFFLCRISSIELVKRFQLVFSSFLIKKNKEIKEFLKPFFETWMLVKKQKKMANKQIQWIGWFLKQNCACCSSSVCVSFIESIFRKSPEYKIYFVYWSHLASFTRTHTKYLCGMSWSHRSICLSFVLHWTSHGQTSMHFCYANQK